MARIRTIYLIHHSHTDIGYTHDQPVLWELERRFLDAALDLVSRGPADAPDTLRWTVETTAPLLHWLQHASDAQVERLRQLEREGRIEVTGMFANLTPLLDADQLIETLQPLALLRERYGLRVCHAMNCDVNGHNWPTVEVLLDAGIEALSMAINEHCGGAPLQRPDVFWWEGASGRRLLVLNGWHYQFGNQIGIPTDPERMRRTWSDLEARLEHKGWPLDCMAIQLTHPFGDNGSVDPRLPDFVRDWNASGGEPQLRLALPRQWWAAVRACAADLPVHRGDWTDYWNFGCISSAREQTMNRQSRSRLRAADALAALPPAPATATATDLLPGAMEADARRLALRAEAWNALHLWDEHTWGADGSVRDPEGEDTAAQWHHKAQYAYRARSLSLLLQRDAVADLARRLERAPGDALVVFNPSAWTRDVGGPVAERLLQVRGLPDDPTASRHFVDRLQGHPRKWLPPLAVEGLGWRVVSLDTLRDIVAPLPSEAAVVETTRHRLVFDRERGGIAAWFDKQVGWDLVDQQAPWPLGGFVHEEVADHAHAWPRHLIYRHRGGDPTTQRGWEGDWRARRTGATLRAHRVYRLPDGWRVEQELDAPGVDGARLTFTARDGDGAVEIAAEWRMRPTTHPEATYIFLPFAVPQATARFDVGGLPVRPDLDQLPGCCHDHFTVQRWVDFSGPSGGVTVATPDNPMVQLGDFHFGRGAASADAQRPWLLGWVTANYWETNFRAHQPGRVQARYVVWPHAGDFDEAAAHRLGEEAAQPVLLTPTWEPPLAVADLPRQGVLFAAPDPPLRLLHVLPVEHGAVLRLQNAADTPGVARLGPGAFQARQAFLCDAFGRPASPLARCGDGFELTLQPRGFATVRLQWGEK